VEVANFCVRVDGETKKQSAKEDTTGEEVLQHNFFEAALWRNWTDRSVAAHTKRIIF